MPAALKKFSSMLKGRYANGQRALTWMLSGVEAYATVAAYTTYQGIFDD